MNLFKPVFLYLACKITCNRLPEVWTFSDTKKSFMYASAKDYLGVILSTFKIL